MNVEDSFKEMVANALKKGKDEDIFMPPTIGDGANIRLDPSNQRSGSSSRRKKDCAC
jgi:hypothetical protein